MKVAREELCLMKYYDYSVVNDKVEMQFHKSKQLFKQNIYASKETWRSIEEFEDELEEILEEE